MLEKIGIIFFCMALLISSDLYAHGTEYEVLSEGVIGIKALFDTGDPMSDSEVIIFAPASTDVYYRTNTDRNGIVGFRPDRPGLWIIQVRDKCGHGMRINLDVDDSGKVSGAAGNSSGTSFVQKIVMAICVIWGFYWHGILFQTQRGWQCTLVMEY